jgi:DNA-directed RNA polymerase subunit RPC12/RpoP
MNANGFDTIECPNCGGTNFEDITPSRHRCVYCGTVLTSRELEKSPDLARCPYCGYENVRGVRYCNQCGKTLTGWLTTFFKNSDPAVVSIIVTVVGTFVLPLPLVGAIIGLVLGYKALKSAREGGGNSEKLAKSAVIVGWVVLACTILPLRIAPVMDWAELYWICCPGRGSERFL